MVRLLKDPIPPIQRVDGPNSPLLSAQQGKALLFADTSNSLHCEENNEETVITEPLEPKRIELQEIGKNKRNKQTPISPSLAFLLMAFKR